MQALLSVMVAPLGVQKLQKNSNQGSWLASNTVGGMA